ncbi:11800_t:CDS:2, partial [Gigaspora margarita]
ESGLGDDRKVCNVVATRTFTLKIAKKESWNVVAGIRDLLDDDLIEIFLKKTGKHQAIGKNSHSKQDKNLKCQVHSLQMYSGNRRYNTKPSSAVVYASIDMRTKEDHKVNHGQVSVVLGLIFQMVLEGRVEALVLTELERERARPCLGSQKSRRGEYCRKDSFGSFSRLLKKGNKTSGIGGVLVGEQDTFVSKKSRLLALEKKPKQIKFKDKELL